MADNPAPEVTPDDLLRDCPDDKVGTYLPFPLNQRLDALLGRLEPVGTIASRKELLAALILEAPDQIEALEELIHRYRSATVKDAVPNGLDASHFLKRHQRKRGRRRYRGPAVPP